MFYFSVWGASCFSVICVLSLICFHCCKNRKKNTYRSYDFLFSSCNFSSFSFFPSPSFVQVNTCVTGENIDCIFFRVFFLLPFLLHSQFSLILNILETSYLPSFFNLFSFTFLSLFFYLIPCSLIAVPHPPALTFSSASWLLSTWPYLFLVCPCPATLPLIHLPCWLHPFSLAPA